MLVVKKAAFGAILVLVAVGFQELAFRVVFPRPEVLNFDRIVYSHLVATSASPTESSLSNASFTWTSEPDGVEYVNRLNLYGFRDGDWRVTRRAGSTRVLFIGDSFVEGFMAAADETIPFAFAARATEMGNQLETMNMGVGGSGIQKYFELTRDAAPLFRPDFVILVIYANDFPIPEYKTEWLAKPLVPEFINPWEPRVLHVATSTLKGRPVARAWKSPPFSYLPAVPDPANPWSDDATAKEFREFVSPRIADSMERGRFNPFVVNEFDMYQHASRMPSSLSPHLRELRDFLQQFSVQLLVAFIPGRDIVSDAYRVYAAEYTRSGAKNSIMREDYRVHASLVRDECSRLGIPFDDLTPALREAEDRGSRLFWNYDSHMNAVGYELVGRELYDYWASKFGKLPSVTPRAPAE